MPCFLESGWGGVVACMFCCFVLNPCVLRATQMPAPFNNWIGSNWIGDLSTQVAARSYYGHSVTGYGHIVAVVVPQASLAAARPGSCNAPNNWLFFVFNSRNTHAPQALVVPAQTHATPRQRPSGHRTMREPTRRRGGGAGILFGWKNGKMD